MHASRRLAVLRPLLALLVLAAVAPPSRAQDGGSGDDPTSIEEPLPPEPPPPGDDDRGLTEEEQRELDAHLERGERLKARLKAERAEHRAERAQRTRRDLPRGFNPLPPEPGAEWLDARAALAWDAVCEHLGVDAPRPVVRFASQSELRAVLDDELLAQREAIRGEGPAAETEASALAAALSSALLAKFATETAEILVCVDNIESLALLLELPELASRETLLAVLVHECVHALDHLVAPLDESFTGCTTDDELQAVAAVYEGHAQHVARAVCEARGWTPGFDAFCEAIVKVPDMDEPALQYALSLVASTAAFAYGEGETFVAAIDAARGADGVRDVLRSPPASTRLVSNPGWFLDPSSRPARVYDVRAPLDRLGEALAEDGADAWTATEVELLPSQLAAGMALLPSEDVEPVLAAIEDMGLVVFADAERPDRQHIGCLMVFPDEASACAMLILQLRLLRAKDAAMAEGMVRIEDPEYEDVELDEVDGVLARKTVRAPGDSLATTTFVGLRGRLVLELSIVRDERPTAWILDVGERLLEPVPVEGGVHAPVPAPVPATGR